MIVAVEAGRDSNTCAEASGAQAGSKGLRTPCSLAGVIPAREAGTRRWAESREEGFHALRHHFASVLPAEGAGVRSLAEFLGHEDPTRIPRGSHEDPGFTLRASTPFMPPGEERMRKAVERALNGRSPDGLARDA